MFLYVEEQVTAFANRIKIPRRQDLPEAHRILAGCQVLAAAADVFGIRSVSVYGDELPRRGFILAGACAIKAQSHESARAQQGKQLSPSRQRICEMVQYAYC